MNKKIIILLSLFLLISLVSAATVEEAELALSDAKLDMSQNKEISEKILKKINHLMGKFDKALISIKEVKKALS